MTLFTLSEADKKNGAESKTAAKGMIEGRTTTDILFLILIIATWVCMSGVGGDAVQRGNVYRLIGPMDESVSLLRACMFTPLSPPLLTTPPSNPHKIPGLHLRHQPERIRETPLVLRYSLRNGHLRQRMPHG